jgi:site-specific recombinase XerD
LFRTSLGRPWTRHALGDRLYQDGKKLGFRVCPYAVRHTFATDAIIRGVDLQTIATLMGHVDLKMLSRIYQHIRKRSDHLRAGLRKAVGE